MERRGGKCALLGVDEQFYDEALPVMLSVTFFAFRDIHTFRRFVQLEPLARATLTRAAFVCDPSHHAQPTFDFLQSLPRLSCIELHIRSRPAKRSITARAVQKLCCPSDIGPRATQHIHLACAQDRAHSTLYTYHFLEAVGGFGLELLGVTRNSRFEALRPLPIRLFAGCSGI